MSRKSNRIGEFHSFIHFMCDDMLTINQIFNGFSLWSTSSFRILFFHLIVHLIFPHAHTHRAHPHKLVGKDICSKGVCTLEINNDTMTATFANLGIQCVKKKDIDDSLKERERIRVDPFRSMEKI